MNATPTPGIWVEDLYPGIKMICNTLFNQITITNVETDTVETYNFEDGIKISDVEMVRNATLRSLGANDDY